MIIDKQNIDMFGFGMIIDKQNIDMFGEDSRKFPDREMDDYDLIGQEIASELREEMEHTMKRYVTVTVE